MGIVARAQMDFDRPATELFPKFIDFGNWPRFMPKGFVPVTGPSGALALGDRFVVQLGPGVRTKLEVTRLRANQEITWRGGLPRLLVGDHAFYFDDLGDGRTRVRSEEPFTGLLVQFGPIGKAVERGASDAGRKMLEGFARFVG